MDTRTPSTFANERRAAVVSVCVGVFLLIVKFFAYALTGSAAIFSDALESIVNVMASGFALYAIVLAHQPADEKHPYGHGKVEFLSAGFEGGLMLLASAVIVWRAIEQIVHRPPLAQIDLGLVLMIFAMLVNGITGLTLVRMGRKNGSVTLEADGWHLLSDAITSIGVLIALAAVQLTNLSLIDPLAAILVAAYIVLVAVRLLQRSAAGLMDEQDLKDHQVIQQIIQSHIDPNGKPPRICSYHKLRHRHSGRYHWVDFHIMVPAKLDIHEGHKIASAIEYEIECALGEGNATAHVEPCAAHPCPHCEMASKQTGERG